MLDECQIFTVILEIHLQIFSNNNDKTGEYFVRELEAINLSRIIKYFISIFVPISDASLFVFFSFKFLRNASTLLSTSGIRTFTKRSRLFIAACINWFTLFFEDGLTELTTNWSKPNPQLIYIWGLNSLSSLFIADSSCVCFL